MRERSIELLLVALGSFLGALVFTWPLASDPSGTLPLPGDALYNSWVLGWVADRAAHALSGVWDTPVFYPYRTTLAYADPMFGISVPLAPVYWLTRNPLALHNTAVWASFVVAGTGGYVLGRDLTGSRAAGVVSGAIAAFLPYRLSHLAHVQVLMVGWLWWTAWSVHRYFANPGLLAAIRVAVFYVLVSLCSFYWAYIAVIPMLAIAAAEAWRRRGPVRRWLLDGAVAAGLAAVVLVPVALAARTVTAPGSAIGSGVDAHSYGADVISYVSGARHLWIWGSALQHASGEADLFPGIVAIACALAGLGGVLWSRARDVTPSARTWVVLYAVLAIVGVVASLGPKPSYDGRALFENPVFTLLTASVPGLAQLRAPARFAVIAQLSLSTLAALGVAAILARTQATRYLRAAIAAAVAAAVFLEGLGAPVPVFSFTPYPFNGDRGTYQWLTRRPGGAVLELPLDGWGPMDYSMLYQHRTLIHGHPIINGVARFLPPLPDVAGNGESPVVQPEKAAESVAFLRNLAVRYVVIHPNLYKDKTLGQRTRSAYAEASGRPTADFGESSIVDLGESPILERPANAAEVPASALQAAATTGRPERMLDGDPFTRWISGRPQSPADAIDLTLATMLTVSGVRMLLLRNSLNDYPRGLEVAVSEDGQHFATVFSGSVFADLGRAVRADPLAPTIEVAWPPARASRVRLRQTGAARWFWSAHELRLLTPR